MSRVQQAMSALWILLALAHPPCLSVQRLLHSPYPLASVPVSTRALTVRWRQTYAHGWPAPPPAPLPAPLSMREDARYSVAYGLIGSIGELRVFIDDEHAEGTRRFIKVGGQGHGSILGIGRSEKRVDGEFDPAALSARRWTMARSGGDAVVDTVEQPQAGTLNMTRQKAGAPSASRTAWFATPTLDPVGLLMRLRAAPPDDEHPLVLQLLDGQALWRVTLTWVGPQPVPSPDDAQPSIGLRVNGRADPIYYDGRDATDRPRRTFVVWLSNDSARVPLRLTMPIGPADVVVQLIEATRRPRLTVAP
ncbi:MAG TPA: DUF3108 domain-containing protein [Polyangia bacterium]|nr:DUF3108 domain-containing protein [Polyangia bacterium]